MTHRLEYTWNCCASLSGYTDAFGTAVLTYDDLGRLLSNTDSAGSEVEYEYDALGRVVKLTPPQGTDYRTQYVYNKNGSLASASVYDAGSPAVTDYAYSTTSGRLLTRDFPEESSNRIRTAYAYDAAGRLEYETVTRESGGTTNLYRTQYAYSWLSYGRQVLRTETEWGGSSWDNSARLTYKYNAPGWQDYEERAEWVASAWVQRYEVAQEYDKNGNRTRYHRNVQGGQTGTYGRNMDLNYTYGELNNPATVTDADDIYYTGTFGVDVNLNITQVVEASGPYSTLYNYYDHDGLNRVTGNRVKYYDGTDWQWVKRQHQYSATGAILKSTYKTWEDGDSEPAGDSLLHAWSQDGKQVQNTDTGGTNYGGVWHWAGSGGGGSLAAGPLRSPNADTASQDAYNVSAGGGAGTPVRRSFIDPTTEGDERNLWAQGMPNAKDSVGAWAAGTISAVTDLLGVEPPVESRFEFKGTVAPTDLSRATDAREKGRVGMFGSGYSYAGSSPRITSETIGRDINPLGRGDGQAYVGGMMRLGQIYPPLPNSTARVGQGNSVNNSMGVVGGGGPAGMYELPDCGINGKLPGCCCETIAADFDSYDEGTPPCHNAEAIIAACYENGCDQEKCLKAKCDHVKCLKESGRPFCTNCDCEGSGGGGAIPVGGGGCGGCGRSGGGRIPDTGDTFGARFSSPSGGGGGIGGLSGGIFRPGASIWDLRGLADRQGTIKRVDYNGSLMALTPDEERYLICATGCERMYEWGSDKCVWCLHECGLLYLKYSGSIGNRPSGATFIDCNDPASSFANCVGGVGSVPRQSAVLDCLRRTLTACGCAGLCRSIYPNNENLIYNCESECCCRYEEVLEVSSSPIGALGLTITMTTEGYTCLCERYNKETGSQYPCNFG